MIKSPDIRNGLSIKMQSNLFIQKSVFPLHYNILTLLWCCTFLFKPHFLHGAWDYWWNTSCLMLVASVSWWTRWHKRPEACHHVLLNTCTPKDQAAHAQTDHIANRSINTSQLKPISLTSASYEEEGVQAPRLKHGLTLLIHHPHPYQDMKAIIKHIKNMHCLWQHLKVITIY